MLNRPNVVIVMSSPAVSKLRLDETPHPSTTKVIEIGHIANSGRGPMSRDVAEWANRIDLDTAIKTLSWLVVSLGLVALTLFVVGINHVMRLLSTADRRVVLSVVVVVVSLTAVRGVGLWVAFSSQGVGVSFRHSVPIYFATSFINTVTPSGQAAGAPISGWLIARTEQIDYETGFAAILTVDVLGNFVLFASGVVGIMWMFVTATVGRGFVVVTLGGGGLFVFFLVGVVAAWTFSDQVLEIALQIAVGTTEVLGQVLPERFVPDPRGVACRIERFGRALGKVVVNPRRLAVLLLVLVLAHILSVLALWLSFIAIGSPVVFSVLLAVIPTAVLGALVPLPGGTGGLDVALIALLITTTGTTGAAAGTAVVLYRTATTGVRVFVGGSLTAALLAFRS